MDSVAGRAYAAFEERIKRTVYLDILSPQVTEAVVRSALDQYGSVINVEFLPNYTEPYNNLPCSALVELEDERRAANVVDELTAYPFMMSGMPRPVRVRRARITDMYENRPEKPGRKIKLCWLDKDDPDFEVSQKLRKLAKKQQAEAAYLLKRQLELEENLSKTQNDTLKSTYQKYEMMENVLNEKISGRLADFYSKRP